MNRVLRAVAVAIFSVCVASWQLQADVINITEGSTSGYTMTDGNTYVVENSVAFSNTTAGGSGMTVEEGATVVLYVPAGVTLTARGAVGTNGANGGSFVSVTGGGAGIRVPETATLIITGEGIINTSGGNAGNGGRGGNGGSGSLTPIRGGVGGYGGQGGGGAGAGIGGCGGAGGSGGETMGNVYILGSMNINATKGKTGASGVSGSAGGAARRTTDESSWVYASGGGGGGGGCGGSAPTYSIGGGGTAGGAGGKGSSGTVTRVYPQTCSPGATGSNGGWAGSNGGAGKLYVSPTATVNVEREVFSATTHPAAQYVITFNANGGQFVSSDESLTVTLGCELPGCIPQPLKNRYAFGGWSTDPNGLTMWYGSEGDKQISSYTITGDTTLYAKWILWIVEAPVFTPVSGTVFDNSLSVSISCPAEGATIHYTTDGSEPTVESPVYRRFRINGKTTVKAIAVKDGWYPSDVVTAEYALGQCADPVITPNDGATFDWAGEQVSISWQGEDGVLRYTTDGSDPTSESPVYDGPFTISDTTVVKAKAFGDQFFDSAVVTANITRVWTDVAMPHIEAANSFTGSKVKVEISCSTDGATVRYTLDGSEPNSHSMKYAGPFYVTDSCMIKAYAEKYDYRDSAVATHSIEKVWGIGDTLGKPDHGFTTDGSDGAGWVKVDDTTAPNGEAMKSGVITHSQSSVLSTTVMGPGTLTFSWRTSCEDSGGMFDWDHAEFAVDGAVLLQRDGISSWAEETVRINGDGEHTVTWTYKKDDVEKDGDDAAYVAGYGWVSDYTETKTTDVPIPYAWLLQNDSEIVDEFDAYEAAANATAANGFNKVWECYVAGISPTNETAKFAAKIEMKDGTPVVTWEPDLNTNGVIRIYKVYGSETLENGGDWQYPTNSLHKFFKVTVEMP